MELYKWSYISGVIKWSYIISYYNIVLNQLPRNGNLNQLLSNILNWDENVEKVWLNEKSFKVFYLPTMQINPLRTLGVSQQGWDWQQRWVGGGHDRGGNSAQTEIGDNRVAQVFENYRYDGKRAVAICSNSVTMFHIILNIFHNIIDYCKNIFFDSHGWN